MLPNLLSTRFGRLVAFFLLYMTEGIPLGFTATAIATQMRRQGVSPTWIGIFVGTLYLPWAWKWIAGPFVDTLYSRRLGRRRGWILGTQLLLGIGLLSLMPIDFVNQLKLFTAAVFIINIFGAVQDVAIDALACGVLSEEERGLANGMMFAGAYSGNAIGGAGVLWLSTLVGFNPTFVFVAASIFAVTVFVVLPLREPGHVNSNAHLPIASQVRVYATDAFRAFFGTRAAIAGLIFAILPAGAYSLTLAIGTNLSVELGLTDERIALLSLLSSVISAGGCVLGGWLSDRVGRRSMLALYIVLMSVPVVLMAAAMQRHGWIMPRDPSAVEKAVAPESLVGVFWIASLTYSLFQGLMYGTRTALFMDVCTAKVAATQFTAYMALLNFVIWYSSSWQGWASEHWGYPVTLSIDAAFGLLCLVVLPFMSRKPASSIKETAHEMAAV